MKKFYLQFLSHFNIIKKKLLLFFFNLKIKSFEKGIIISCTFFSAAVPRDKRVTIHIIINNDETGVSGHYLCWLDFIIPGIITLNSV